MCDLRSSQDNECRYKPIILASGRAVKQVSSQAQLSSARISRDKFGRRRAAHLPV
jgi:hypothetical protein